MKKNLIYLCAFLQNKYIKEIDLMLKSLYEFGKKDNNTDILIITEDKLYTSLNKLDIIKKLNVEFYILNNVKTVLDSTISRYRIFSYKNINNYGKLLYLDTDILILNELNNIFSIESNKFIFLEEGYFGSEYFGKYLFPDSIKNEKIPACNTGIIYFKNLKKHKLIFEKVINKAYLPTTIIDSVYDQPILNYFIFYTKNYDNTSLKNIGELNPKTYNGETLTHFNSIVGCSNKLQKMTNFYKLVNKKYRF